MRFCLVLVFCFWAVQAFAQDKPIAGLIFDQATHERIAKVNVRNLRSGQSVYNNLKAEFKITAQPGDMLVFSKTNYFSDTLKIKNYTDQIIYLKASSIMLQEVNVRDTVLSAQKRFEQTKRAYSKIYGSLNNRDLLSVGPSGAGISIDGLWNSLSRSGRNAEHLRNIIEQDYKVNVIDQRFNKTLVQQITGLQEPQLSNFMMRYRPSYYLVTTASDYEFATYVKSNVKRFLRYPNLAAMPPLKP